MPTNVSKNIQKTIVLIGKKVQKAYIWVYRKAKLWYTVRKFLTLDCGGRLQCSDRFIYYILYYGGRMDSAFSGLPKSLFVEPVYRGGPCVYCFDEKESDSFI